VPVAARLRLGHWYSKSRTASASLLVRLVPAQFNRDSGFKRDVPATNFKP